MRLVKCPYKRLPVYNGVHLYLLCLSERPLDNACTPHIYQREVVYSLILFYFLRYCFRVASLPQFKRKSCHKPQVLLIYIGFFSECTAKCSSYKVCYRTLYPVLSVKQSYKLAVRHVLQSIAFQCGYHFHSIFHLDIVAEIVISVYIGNT